MPGSLCHRIGPGRLPYASRRDVGGGIAMAATALLAVVLWGGGSALALAADLVDLSGFVAGAALLLAAPLAVPATFLVGTAFWRRFAPSTPSPRRGAALGAGSALGSLVLTACGAAALLFADFANSTATGDPIELVVFPWLLLFGFAIATAYAVVLAGWLVVPLGAFGGWYHERARRKQSGPAAEQHAIE